MASNSPVTVTVDNALQADVAQQMFQAASELRRALISLRVVADNDLKALDEGIHPFGVSGNTLTDVSAAQAAFSTTRRVAYAVSLSSGQIEALTTTTEYPLIRIAE